MLLARVTSTPTAVCAVVLLGLVFLNRHDWPQPAHVRQQTRARLKFAKLSDSKLKPKQQPRQVSFVTRAGSGEGSAIVPMLVWVIWLGQPMAGVRLAAFRALERSVGVPVRLVQEADLKGLSRPEDPFHPAFFSGAMSSIHRGDYLRAYLMHHWGGG
jgi:hypothetical protein